MCMEGVLKERKGHVIMYTSNIHIFRVMITGLFVVAGNVYVECSLALASTGTLSGT